MPSVWAFVCFAIWVGTGFLVWRRLPELRARLAEVARGKRVATATSLLFGSAIVAIGGFFAMSQSTAPGAPIAPLQWLLIALLGAVFVGSQTLAAAILFSVVHPSVTSEPSPPSINQNLEDPTI